MLSSDTSFSGTLCLPNLSSCTFIAVCIGLKYIAPQRAGICYKFNFNLVLLSSDLQGQAYQEDRDALLLDAGRCPEIQSYKVQDLLISPRLSKQQLEGTDPEKRVIFSTR